MNNAGESEKRFDNRLRTLSFRLSETSEASFPGVPLLQQQRFAACSVVRRTVDAQHFTSFGQYADEEGKAANLMSLQKLHKLSLLRAQ